MSQSPVLTLLSDFGTRDAYVGMMKGAIAQINSTLTVIDLTHVIPPQAIAHARFILMSAFPYFPLGTVHVAVVDPGVGSDRRGIALAVGNDPTQPTGFLVGPDNGIFSGVLAQYPVLAGVELTHSAYWRTPQRSDTFHGRDVFAPVAAHLASGVPLTDLGTTIAPESLVHWALPPWIRSANTIQGCIQAIDHFGNLITNIPATEIVNQEWSVAVEHHRLPGVTTYSDRPPDSPIALIGSHGWVELAIVQGSAQAKLNLNLGDSVKIILQNRA